MKNIKIFFCLVIITCAHNSLAMEGNCVHNALTMKDEENYEQRFEDSEFGRAQKGINDAFVQNLSLRNNLVALRTKFKKNKHLFTEKEQNELIKNEREISTYLNDAQDAKDNANATVQKNTMISTLHLSYANNYINAAKSLLEKYKNAIDTRIQERTAKL